MSTKIHTAWRVSITRLNGFIDSYRNNAIEAVVSRVVKRMNDFWPDEIGTPPEHIPEKYRARWIMRRKFDLVIGKAENSAQSPYRDVVYDIECGLNIWIRGKYAYVIPHGEEWIHENFKVPKYAHDFSYWDSTDRPEEVPSSSWWKRKNAWNKLCLGSGKHSHNARRMYHEIVYLSCKRNSYVSRELLWSALCLDQGADE